MDQVNEAASRASMDDFVRRPLPSVQRKELHKAGFFPGELAGCECVDCGKACGRGWWMKVSYEYNEWECWCRECAYDKLHYYDDFDPEEFMRISGDQ